ncbi:outer membrane beta-barrel protein [Longitalea luteola]|uniref:outer membrane beta-barrel protein n=1 Tax=Longitalea luteola TaxID=2812563 RepID=UPI001A97A8C6|nr:outer membrane beta-barrel protein [Longitalea luteola]
MKHCYLLVFSCFLYSLAWTQQKGIVKGLVYDTLLKQPVVAATVTLLQRKDSSLVTFAMTDSKGQFEITGLPNGEYRLLTTHVSYHNTSKLFTIDDSHKQVNLGNIIMNDVSRLLQEVTVTAEAPPVTLMGDTVQYNAGSFKTVPNATVEQLLKKMPGIKIEKDGTVTAQGQEVKKVLVDGKEFFGNDPKIATRNLPADAVDKVQVYDKMSDQAQLTGFDDGNSEKTINLKLKKDKNKGMFGKVTAGGGTSDRYEGKFNVNSFKGARQFSVIGMGNNTNAEGFSFMDMLSFNNGMGNMQQGGGGGIQLSIRDDGPNSNDDNNNGIKTIWGGGFNYNDLIGNKTQFTSNYFYNRYNPNTESHIHRQYYLADSSYYYNQNAFANNLNNSHKINLSADIQLDSFHSIKISPSLGYQQTNNKEVSDYKSWSLTQIPGSSGSSQNETNSRGYNFKNDLLFRKKFRRGGRTVSLSLQNNMNASDGDGSLRSSNTYRNTAGTVIRTDSISQHNTSSSDLNSYTARLVYTEPVFKRSLLEFSVATSNSKSTAHKTTYDYDTISGKFDRLNDRLTNNYENEYGYYSAGLRWRMQQRKFNASVGMNWQQARLEGHILTKGMDSIISKTFPTLLPNARLQYNFTKFRNLRLNYSTTTKQPTVSQLQPVPDNSNPLNIKAGNADLQQELTHSVQLNFFSVNPFRNRNLFAFFNLRRTDNKIVDADTIDSVGVKTTRPVNVDGAYDLSGSINLGLPLPFLKGTVNVNTYGGYTRNKTYINGAENMISTLTVGPDVRFDINATEKLDISLSAGMNYYRTQYGLQQSLNTEYLNQQYSAEINWQLPNRFFFNTEFTYAINSQRASGFNAKVPLWNVFISKQFLRFNRGEIKLSVFDLLKQNIGVSRSTSQNYIEDKRVTNLQRYFLLSFTYSLTKNGLSAPNDKGGVHIIKR